MKKLKHCDRCDHQAEFGNLCDCTCHTPPQPPQPSPESTHWEERVTAQCRLLLENKSPNNIDFSDALIEGMKEIVSEVELAAERRGEERGRVFKCPRCGRDSIMHEQYH
jgi:hypothetical protein